MSATPKLNFPDIKLRAQRRGESVEVWDNLRGMFLVLTPEEWVRRHLVAYLIDHCGVEEKSIIEEYPVPLNGQSQRADVVVVDKQGQPLIVVECKAPHIDIGPLTFDQAVRYNSVLGGRFVILTNGMNHYCYELCDGQYVVMAQFPNLACK